MRYPVIWSTGAYPPGCTQRDVDEAVHADWDDQEEEGDEEYYDPEPEDMTNEDWAYWLSVVAKET